MCTPPLPNQNWADILQFGQICFTKWRNILYFTRTFWNFDEIECGKVCTRPLPNQNWALSFCNTIWTNTFKKVEKNTLLYKDKYILGFWRDQMWKGVHSSTAQSKLSSAKAAGGAAHSYKMLFLLYLIFFICLLCSALACLPNAWSTYLKSASFAFSSHLCSWPMCYQE